MACRMSSVQPVLSALLQLPFQTEEWKLCVEPWKAVLDMRKRVPMDLGMIFFLPEYGCTSAELSMEEKNKISHRGKALQAIKEELR